MRGNPYPVAGQHLSEALGNNFAVNPNRAGFKHTMRLRVAGNESSVILLITRPDGQHILLNMSRSGAVSVMQDIQAALAQRQGWYDPHGIMRRKGGGA